MTEDRKFYNRETTMLCLSATDVDIRLAAKNGTLRIGQHEGRFGPYWAISDETGLIEVANSYDEAHERVRAVTS